MTPDHFISRYPLPERLGDYAAHRRVYEVIPERPLYRRMGPFAFVVSDSPPTGSAECKPYTPAIRDGERLRFLLRADISKTRFERGKRGRRFDPVLAERNAASSRPYPDIARDVGNAWLERKGADNGFSVIELLRADYSPLAFVRPSDRRSIRLPVIDFEGTLKVTDQRAFTKALVTGIGRGKGFGCGLMLVRRMNGRNTQ